MFPSSYGTIPSSVFVWSEPASVSDFLVTFIFKLTLSAIIDPAGLLWYVIVPASFSSSITSSTSKVSPYSSQNSFTSSKVYPSFTKSGYSLSIFGIYKVIVSPFTKVESFLADWSIIKSSLPLYLLLSSTAFFSILTVIPFTSRLAWILL